MARMFPSQIPSDKPKSEKTIFEQLEGLPKEFLVFYSVLWQSKRGGQQGDGEADFIVLHPSRGILVVEVKGGTINIEGGEWYSTGEGGRNKIKNPFQQAIDSKFALIGYLKNLGLGHVPVNHCVAFPNERSNDAIGTYGPREIIWYRNDLASLGEKILQTFEHWGSRFFLDQSQVGSIVRLLAPTTRFKKSFLNEVENANEELLELTERQIAAFRQLRRNRKVVVLGGAGTGKTILAIERVKQLSDDGFRTLFVCYNELIGKHIANQFRETENVLAARYHSLCVGEARRVGLTIPEAPSGDWWEYSAPEILVEAAGKNGLSFDAIVIDEGQDFSHLWIDSLSLLCRDAMDPPIYVFMDNRQDLYSRKWTPSNEYFFFELDVNCRNTHEIARHVSDLFDEEPLSLGCSGPEPVFIEADPKMSLLELVQVFVERLLREEGLRPDQIVVLSNETKFISRLKNIYAGDVPFTGFGKVGIVSETIKRFKGLECDVLVLVVIDEFHVNRIEELYVGMSRAKTGLFVVGSKSLRNQIKWKSNYGPTV